MEYFTLNTGAKMPMDGIGVFLLTPEQAETSVYSAIKDGVRLIDTANAYMNEKAVGRAVRKAIEEGLVKREDLFIVTKLWPTVYEDEKAVDSTLKRLDLDYVDLLFLHQPAGNWRKGYENMEKAYQEGKVKALGLSNFFDDELDEIIAKAEVKPSMVQVEAHPYFPQTELKKKLAANGMGLMAWYPLGHGDKSLLNEKVFADLAEKYHKTPAQVILRWHVQSGNVVIPGSKNPDHIRDNFNIFDFSLTDEEMASIAKLDKNVRYYNSSKQDVEKYASMSLDFDSQK